MDPQYASNLDSVARKHTLKHSGQLKRGRLPSAARPAPLKEQDMRAMQIDIFQKLINGLPEQIALLDSKWTVIAVNTAWANAARLDGLDELQPGFNYRRALEQVLKQSADGMPCASGSSAGVVGAIVAAMREIDQGKRTSFRHVYSGEAELAGREFHFQIAQMELGGKTYSTVTRFDVTEQEELRKLREDFSTVLIKTQDEERRRMGREIHDSTMQLLVGVGLAVGQLKRNGLHGEAPRLVADIEGMLYEAQRELRTLSYLAHPPQLDRVGLTDALEQLVGGFSRRAELKSSFEIVGGPPNLALRVQMAIYRVVQEALANVHRHARATELAVRLVARGRTLHVLIVDNGRGIPVNINPGVGLLGMRSRLDELAGRLTVRNISPGTVIIASLPI
jgi:signal transduction histidine kinase